MFVVLEELELVDAVVVLEELVVTTENGPTVTELIVASSSPTPEEKIPGLPDKTASVSLSVN